MIGSMSTALRLPSPDAKLVILLAGQLISLLGTTINQAALPLLVIDRFGIGLSLGFVLAARLVPRILLGPLAGIIVDRLPRRAVIAATSLTTALLVALIPFSAALWQLYALAVAVGILDALARPAHFALLPDVFPKEQLYRVNTAQEVLDGVANLAGPVIAVTLAATLGLTAAFLVDAATFVLATTTLLVLKPLPRHEDGERDAPRPDHPTGTMTLVLGILRREPLLIVLLAVNAAYTAGIGALQVLFAPLAFGPLGGDEIVYGALLTASGVGALAGVALVPRVRSWLDARWLLAILATSGLVLSGIGLTATVWLAAPLVALALLPESGAYLIFTTEAQRRIPAGMAGRFYGIVFTAVSAALPVGNLIGGVLAASVAPDRAMAIVGGGWVVLAIGGWWLVRRYTLILGPR